MICREGDSIKTLKKASLYAILAAVLYALNMPFSKLLLEKVPPLYMSAFLYLGAGTGMFLLWFFTRRSKNEKIAPVSTEERPFIIGMILLDILAPALLMFGLRSTHAANASLLNNFEIVGTSMIALMIFKETITQKLWIAILLVTAASIVLSLDSSAAFSFSTGSLLILGATLAWGLENNFTRRLSNRTSSDIVIIKGFGSGLGSLILAIASREAFPQGWLLPSIMLLGFVAYGLSINYYVKAQKELGAAKTSAYYAFAPFIGVAFSLIIFPSKPDGSFWLGLILMGMATWFLIHDTIGIQHTHEHTHQRIITRMTAQGPKEFDETYTHSHFHAHNNEAENEHEHTHS
ncbi:MAG: DMT family transporter [Anaerolineaceae bacterium]|jgi:drug/metabolite transporter (DMT)-like permease